MPNGEIITLNLAENAKEVDSIKNANGMREVSTPIDSGYQNDFISTAFDLPLQGACISRWGQEGFFRYMMRHCVIDLFQE
jgi:hypothetical protein